MKKFTEKYWLTNVKSFCIISLLLYLHHQRVVVFLTYSKKHRGQTWRHKNQSNKDGGAGETQVEMWRWRQKNTDHRGNTELQMQASPAGLQSRGSDPRASVSLIGIFGFSDEIHCCRNHEHTEKKHGWTWCWQTDTISHTIRIKEQ